MFRIFFISICNSGEQVNVFLSKFVHILCKGWSHFFRTGPPPLPILSHINYIHCQSVLKIHFNVLNLCIGLSPSSLSVFPTKSYLHLFWGNCTWKSLCCRISEKWDILELMNYCNHCYVLYQH